MKFDKEQKRAINHISGPLLLIAGPGSGKTTTMIERLANMIDVHNINPERILVITFSRAAASEMKSRFQSRIYPKNHNVFFGTFHSAFLSMIKSYFGNKMRINVVTEDIKKKYVELLLKEEGYEYILHDFIDEFLLDVTLYKNSECDFHAYKPVSCDFNLFSRLYTGYEKLMLNEQNMDFDDIIILMNNLLKHNEAFKTYWQNRYDYILIDEFQDINELQFSAVYQLAEKHKNLFAVGDEDQSIYGFRGSKPDIMINFQKIFNETEIIYLTGNYRSGEKIVKIASDLISNNKKRYFKSFRAYNKSESEVKVLKFNNFKEQAEEIIKTIETIKPNSMAILCRTNADKFSISKALNEHAEKINILTMHECKGLEFDFVWIINAANGVCPFKHPLYKCDIEEERRLFYVAVTRAKKKLYISYCKGRKGLHKKKSIFIKELKL